MTVPGTLSTLRRAASAVDCENSYTFSFIFSESAASSFSVCCISSQKGHSSRPGMKMGSFRCVKWSILTAPTISRANRARRYSWSRKGITGFPRGALGPS